MVVGAPRKGLKVTYTTDTRPVPVIAEAAKGADLFICEGMYGEPDKDAKAREHKHMTFKEAAKIAKEAQPKEMMAYTFQPFIVRPLDVYGYSYWIYLKMLKQERMECLLIYVLRTKLININ